MPFTTTLYVREVDERYWKLTRPLEYQGNTDTFHVPAGFETDFASVPRAFWNAFPPYGKYTKAAVLHDYFYATQPISRKDADGIFRRTMKELGVGWLRRRTMYRMVRMFGWAAWRRAAK